MKGLPGTPELAYEIGKILEREWERDREEVIPERLLGDEEVEEAMRKVYMLGGFSGGRALVEMYRKYNALKE